MEILFNYLCVAIAARKIERDVTPLISCEYPRFNQFVQNL